MSSFQIPVYEGTAAAAWLKSSQKTMDAQATESDTRLQEAVCGTLAEVATGGDAALKAIAARFGDAVPESLRLPESAIAEANQRLAPETKQVLETAYERIHRFAQAVMDSLQPVKLNQGDFWVGMDFKPVERAGCYVPGGRYPLPSTALMTATTATVAGVQDVCICSPRLGDEVIYAGTLAGVKEFYQIGGAQAVAAMAFGTESIARVDVIVGPGNAYVTEAKRQIQGQVGIDMLAGPSEVAIIADGEANPRWVALDLISQAEHDPMARAYLLTDSQSLATQVAALVPELVQELKLPDYLAESLAGSAILVLDSMAACVAATNSIAPEHLQLNVREPEALKPQLKHYGALFMGYAATVPFGDYMAGPNHTLPTGRTARFSGGLTPLTFLRPQSWIQVQGEQASGLARETAAFAQLEGLTGHGAAASARSL